MCAAIVSPAIITTFRQVTVSSCTPYSIQPDGPWWVSNSKITSWVSSESITKSKLMTYNTANKRQYIPDDVVVTICMPYPLTICNGTCNSHGQRSLWLQLTVITTIKNLSLIYLQLLYGNCYTISGVLTQVLLQEGTLEYKPRVLSTPTCPNKFEILIFH